MHMSRKQELGQYKRMQTEQAEQADSKFRSAVQKIISINKQGVGIACQQGQLFVKEFQLAGKKRLTAAQFLNGCSLELGNILQ